MIEEWRAVLGYEGVYEVSDLGRVRSVAHVIVRANGARQSIAARLLATRGVGSRRAYLGVHLSHMGVKSDRGVHTLVAEAFIGPRPDGREVRHINGDGRDNRAENLAWGTHSENELDKVRHGTHQQASKIACKSGHQLAGRNLIRARQGRRDCRACNYAQGYLLRHPDADRQQIADGYYEKWK
jgi:hypothetical protein